jgi:hypothetical protein
MRCYYNRASPEAYAVSETGEERRIEVRLCEWPDQNPDRFVDAPRWLLRLIGGGLAITPERDCVGCPGFRAPPLSPEA